MENYKEKTTARIENLNEKIAEHISIQLSWLIYGKDPVIMSKIGKLSLAGNAAIKKLNLLLESCGDDEALFENLNSYLDATLNKNKINDVILILNGTSGAGAISQAEAEALKVCFKIVDGVAVQTGL